MLHRISDIIGAAAGLFDARARLAARRFERAGVRVAAMLAASLVAVGGLGLLLAGGLIALAGRVGWAAALGLSGAAAALAGAAPLVIIAFLHRRGGKARVSERVLEARGVQWREKLATALGQDGRDEAERPGGTPHSSPRSAQELLRALVGQALANPAPVVAGIVAASGLLGFGRTFRLLAKAAVVSGSVLPLLQRVTDWLTTLQETDRQRRAATQAEGGEIAREDSANSDGERVGRG